jgi:hypothetical protein
MENKTIATIELFFLRSIFGFRQYEKRHFLLLCLKTQKPAKVAKLRAL